MFKLKSTTTTSTLLVVSLSRLWLKETTHGMLRNRFKIILTKTIICMAFCALTCEKSHSVFAHSKLGRNQINLIRRRAQRALNKNLLLLFCTACVNKSYFNTLQIWRCMSQFYYCFDVLYLSHQWNKHFMCALHNHVRNHVATMCFVLCNSPQLFFNSKITHRVSLNV